MLIKFECPCRGRLRGSSMTEIYVAGLGLESPALRTVARKNDTVCGILHLAIEPVARAHYQAERAHKQELRQSENVVLLDDFR
jgi:hypothetical protein